MPIDCLNPPCKTRLPISSVVNIYGTFNRPENTDCSMNILYLVDEAGLVDQSDPTSNPLLTTDNRTIQISSPDQVKLYFSPCSRIYWELVSRFFTWEVGTLQRPSTITLGYFDSDNETMLEALDEIYKCFKCFKVVTHTLYDKNNVALYDTEESIDLAEWTELSKNHFAVVPTVDYVSVGGQLKSLGYDYSANILLNETCVNELDDNCEETDTIINTYDVNHLGLAAVLASISDKSNSYSHTVKFTPKNNAFYGLATADLSLEDTRLVTGVNPFNGGVDSLSNQHTNVYHNVGGSDIFIEGLTNTGRYIDEIIHKIYMKKQIESDIFDLFLYNNSVAISDLTQLQNTLVSTIGKFEGQGLISKTANSLNLSQVLERTGLSEDNVFLQGNGWVLLNYQTTPANVNSRISPTFIFCYVRPGSMHFASVGLCQSEIAEV